MKPDNPPLPAPATRLTDLHGGPGCVALTFDDGPQAPWTDRVLDVLEGTGTPATFFVLGARIRGHEETLRRMLRCGCAIEVHSWEHVPMTDQEPDQWRADIDRTRRLIRDVTGYDPVRVRPPYGCASPDVLAGIRSAGLTPVFWSVDARDWTRPGTTAIEDDIVAGLSDGAVILLHDGGGDRSQTVAALARIIGAINERGLTPVSLSGLPVRPE